MAIFCSTIIPTIGRPTVERAVQSALQQDVEPAADFTNMVEVIVVNDSGQPLPAAEWHNDARVCIVDTNRRERSVARNTGAALARGEYLHFLDDDDWILPGTLRAFQTLVQSCEIRSQEMQSQPPNWFYGRTQLIDRREQPLIQLDHGINGNGFVQAIAGEWIPLQSSLIAAKAFFAVGGFEPLISGPEDIDLLRRITLHGELAGMDRVVSCLGMGAEGSSTDTARHAERSRWAREKILDQPGVFTRLHRSAHSAAWQGRWARIYITSMLWNLKKGNVFNVFKRACYGVAALILSIASWSKLDFWRAMTSAYESSTFAEGRARSASDD